MEGDSQLAHTTRYSRGTPCYRAPELIQNDIEPLSKYTNKVDIWALGCILFELLFAKKAFASDFAVRDYSQNNTSSWKRLELPFEQDTILDKTEKIFVSRMIHKMLELDVSKRPAAVLLQRQFHSRIVSESIRPLSASKSGHLEMSMTMSTELESVDVQDLQVETGKIIHRLAGISNIQGWRINLTDLPVLLMRLEIIRKLYKTPRE